MLSSSFILIESIRVLDHTQISFLGHWRAINIFGHLRAVNIFIKVMGYFYSISGFSDLSKICLHLYITISQAVKQEAYL